MVPTRTKTPKRTDVMVFGAGGMLANAFRQIVRQPESGIESCFLSEADVDLTNADRITTLLESRQPRWVINLAAYTDVDGAEDAPQTAFRVNGSALRFLGRICQRTPCQLLHLSTDYVFGNSAFTPNHEGWRENDPVGPLNTYGASKLIGENLIRRSGCRYVILRSAWLFAAHGRNFVRTITNRLRAGESVRVINDQIGKPTSCTDLARTMLQILQTDLQGTFHAVNAGPAASWYDLACCIRDILGLPAARVQPCATHEFPSKAIRPPFSALDCSKLASALTGNPLTTQTWPNALRAVINEISATETRNNRHRSEPEIILKTTPHTNHATMPLPPTAQAASD